MSEGSTDGFMVLAGEEVKGDFPVDAVAVAASEAHVISFRKKGAGSYVIALVVKLFGGARD